MTGILESGATESVQSRPLSATNTPYFFRPFKIACAAGEKPRIVDHGESKRAQQQSGKADQKERAPSNALREPPNPRSRRDDNELRNNDQRRQGERGARARLAYQCLAGQRQD